MYLMVIFLLQLKKYQTLKEYWGNHVLLAYDEYMHQLVGFMFDQYGYYIEDLGSPEDQRDKYKLE